MSLEESIAEQKDVVRADPARVIFLDFEISPMWGPTFDAYKGPLLWVDKDPQILVASWSFLEDTDVKHLSIHEYPGFNHKNISDKKLIYDLHYVLSEVDIIVGHNVQGFDIKHFNSRLLAHHLPPIPEHQYFDTLKKAWTHFNLPKNTLDEVYRYTVKKEGKTKEKYSDLIRPCLEGKKEAWDKMVAYCNRDVEMVKEIYPLMRPFAQHPNMAFFEREGLKCPRCLSKDVKRRAKRFYRTGYRYQYQCQGCGGYFRGELFRENVEKVNSFT